MGETATVCGVLVSAEYEADVQSQPTLLDMGSSFSLLRHDRGEGIRIKCVPARACK
jgi:hypothetical protein